MDYHGILWYIMVNYHGTLCNTIMKSGIMYYNGLASPT